MKYIPVILLFLVACAPKQHLDLKEQNLHPLEVMLKVYEESEDEYLAYVAARSNIRQKINEKIEPEDQLLIEKVNTAYENRVNENYIKILGLLDSLQNPWTETTKEIQLHMKERFLNKVRCHTDVMTPFMLENEALEKKAIYLANKYRSEVESIQPAIGKEYKKLQNARSKAALKYRSQKDRQKMVERQSKYRGNINLEPEPEPNAELSRVEVWSYMILLMVK